MRHRGQPPQQVLELCLPLGAGAAEAFQDSTAGGLPETGGVEELDDEEKAAVALHPFTDLTEQVCLAGACLPPDHHAERTGIGMSFGVTERGQYLGQRIVVQTADVRVSGMPDVVEGHGPVEPQTAQCLAPPGIHHSAIAIRCLR